MTVDSFKYLPRLIKRYYQMSSVSIELPIPWTKLSKPLHQARFGLVTSGGLFHKGYQSPFDLAGEINQPTWGDPTYRAIPSNIQQAEVGASHHHINTDGVLKDINVLLPVNRFQELVAAGRIGSLADQAYSFMGYQGFPSDLNPWKQEYGPQVADALTADEVDCVLLTTA